MRSPTDWIVLLLVATSACSSSAGTDTGGDGGPPADGGPSGSGDDGSTSNGHDAGSKGDGGDAGSASDGGTTINGGLHVVRGQGGQPGHLVDGSNQNVQLRGVDRFGTETDCTAFDNAGGGPQGPFDQGDIDAIKSWKANAIRVPLNEGCWLGTQKQPNYQKAVQDWVNLVTTSGLIAIVDLHWSTPSMQASQAAMSNSPGQQAMADTYNSVAFWTGVATAFKGNSNVIFDLYNEPNVNDWTCWLTGGSSCGGANFDVAGMAQLLKTVRATGATNVVIMGGIAYAGDLTQWQATVAKIPTLPAPNDGLSLDNVAASVHVYDFNSAWSGCPSQFNGYASTCNTAQKDADNQGISSVLSAGYPIVMGEMGISVFSSNPAPYSATQATELSTWFEGMLTWADQQGQSYVAWSWNDDGTPHLVTDYSGTPTPTFGTTYQAHLAKF
jgi:hypothetical protein